MPNMALNGPGVYHRTREHEQEDASNITKNILAQSWKSWPNEAAFDRLEEHRGPLRLTVRGTFPPWAAGSLYRTGPGQSRVEDTARGTHFTTHWFDGFAQTHRFDIIPSEDDETQVWYSSRRQADEWIADVKKKGWRSGMTFGQKSDPCVGIFAKVMTVFEPKLGNHNVALLANVPGVPEDEKTEVSNGVTGPLGHRVNTSNLFVSTDYTGIRRIDPSTLQPLGETTQYDLHPSLSGPCSCSHAQRDPDSGDLFNFNLAFGRVPTYRIFRVDAASGETEVLATISDLNVPPAYMHSFFLTENHVVICIPASHYAWRGLKTQWEGNIIDSMKPFDKERKCKWLVVDRRHGKGLVATFSTPAAFFFHSINAFEEKVKDEDGAERTDLFFDMAKYENMDIIKGFYYDVLMDRDDATKKYWFKNDRYKNCAPTLTRYRFRLPPKPTPDTTFSASAEEVLAIPSPHAGELPTIHPLRNGKPYRYVYSASMRGLTTSVDALVKTDLDTSEAFIWTGPEGHTPGEPVFVPRPGAVEEDDGIIFSLVVDGVNETSYILCLNGKTMEEMGRAQADFAIGQGFHGIHLPAA